jgi:FMN-dependent NADH-azoreductase
MSQTVLHISASPKGEHSFSGKLALTFLDHYRAARPEDMIIERNVFSDMPEAFGKEAAIAKFAPFMGEARSETGEAAWEKVKAEIAALDAADKLLISCPMWNYSIPWALKLWFDTIVQPGLTFGYDFQTMRHIGMLKNRPVQLILTRSSTDLGRHYDYQASYLSFILESIGLADIRTIAASRTTNPDAAARATYLDSFGPALETAAGVF